jgi:hypothetical protein
MAICPKIVNGDIVRATRVDNCGAPVEGAGNAFVDDCWPSAAMASNVQAGTDITLRAANGSICAFKRGKPGFRGFDLTFQFFNASPEFVELLTGSPLVLDHAGDPIGWEDCDVVGNFAFEIWADIAGEECPDDSEGIWFYLLLPWVSNGRLGDITINDGGVTFEMTGNTRDQGRWSLGPWDVVAQDVAGTPGPLLTEIGDDCHRRVFQTTIAPPTAACETVTVPANNTPAS